MSFSSRGSGVGGRGSVVVIGAVLLLLVVSAGTASAQSEVALRAAVLYGVERQAAGVERPVGTERLPTPDAGLPIPPDTVLADPWLGRDKALHAAGSFLLTLSAQYVLTAKLDADEGTALPLAAGMTLSLGLAKEVADSRRPVSPLFSPRDLAADAVGVALAVGLILL